MRCCKKKPVEIGIFSKGVGHFWQIFWVEGTIPSNLHWSGKTRDIPVSYSVEMLTEDYFVLSQYMHDLTDRRTELRQQYHALYYMYSHGKNVWGQFFSRILLQPKTSPACKIWWRSAKPSQLHARLILQTNTDPHNIAENEALASKSRATIAATNNTCFASITGM